MRQFSNFLSINASMHSDRLALVCEGKEMTWKDLNAIANRIANGLTDAGIKKGDRIAYMLDNGSSVVELFHASQKIGAAALAINTHFLAGEISRVLNSVSCKAVFYQTKYEETIKTVMANVPSLKFAFSCDEGISCNEYPPPTHSGHFMPKEAKMRRRSFLARMTKRRSSSQAALRARQKSSFATSECFAITH